MSDERVIQKRIENAVKSHRRRARKNGEKLAYNGKDLLELVMEAVYRPCHFCQEILTDRTWSCDHKEPVSRGGGFGLNNVHIICRKCNEVKGALTEEEFTDLRMCLEAMDRRGRDDVLGRLRRGSFRRRAAK